jgi:ribosomal protein S27AE
MDWLYCPECKSMLISSRGRLICRKCGYIRKIDSDDQMKQRIQRSENRTSVIEPHYTKLTCPKCGSDCQTACLGPHIIPNFDPDSFAAGYLVQCDKCGANWFYKYDSV